ncbi:MAG TPA: 2-amino-4-hydroxy-6-hydroxymethyldihydropteridine diphosphokinase [Kofleriaceae bacterium]|nr:2-amino-4-hydroxy-6-hydroxymethyldihydropteridine diphosphokinase [Kofleriaceae bacterium]
MIALGFGGNVGDVRASFVRAREALAQLGDVRSASLYRSAPIGPEQPAFLNTAIRVRDSDLQPDELLATLRELERLLGRDRSREVRWGPRTLDLDVLLWDARVIRTPELEVPHPRLAERRFVVLPLIDLFGEAFVVGEATLGALAARVADQEVELVAERW